MSVSFVTVFIRERSGDYNHEEEFDTRSQARCYIEEIRKDGGYWGEGTLTTEVFIPWHRIDHIELNEHEDK